jgi:hypothetical protein
MNHSLRYLHKIKHYQIMYNGMIANNNLKIFCDANFVRDLTDCKSYTQ